MTIKAILPTVLFYVTAVFAVMLLNAYSPSGPCAPGNGIMLLLFLIPVVVFLVLKNIYKALFRNKENWTLVVVHAVIIAVVVALMNL